ncbi:MAG: SPASM domain-containing protein [bacterium]
MTGSRPTPPADSGPSAALRGFTVIFKGSNRCNAKCTFCSVGQPGARVVSWDDFEIVASNLEALVAAWPLGRLEFTFHGGEPTLLGADFIDRACERIRRLPLRTSFSMQSNLLSWDDDIDRVVEKHGITVGSSLDPIAGDRLDAKGENAYPTWLKNYLRVASKRKAPGAIFVVTRKALGQARTLFEIAESIASATGQRFGLQVNPVYGQGRAAEQDSVLITPEEFGGFLIEMWQAWRASPDAVRLTPIEDIANYFFPVPGRTVALSCTFNRDCSRSHVGIDYDLNVASCGRRLDSGAMLGNLKDRSLLEIIEEAEESLQISERADRLRQTSCQECGYFEICFGGCPDDADIATGDLRNRFEWCTSYRMLFEAMDAARVDDAQPDPAAHRPARVDIEANVIQAVTAPSEIASIDSSGSSTSIWLLPEEAGTSLRFESGLAAAMDASDAQFRLWVHNRHVPALTMLEEQLRRGNVAVSLFEGEGLTEALHILNDLGAFIALDVPSILQTPTAGDTLAELLERFLHDDQWRSQIFPFSHIMLAAVNAGRPRYLNRWGLEPGNYQLELSETAAGAEGLGAELIRALRREEAFTPTEFLSRRTACRECRLLPICGGQLALGDGDKCHPGAFALVETIQQVGRKLESDLKALPRRGVGP